MLHTPDHHLFLSYARKDNNPRGGVQTGWVTAFTSIYSHAPLAATTRERSASLITANMCAVRVRLLPWLA